MTEALVRFFPDGNPELQRVPADGRCQVERSDGWCLGGAAVRMWVGCEHEHMGSHPLETCAGCAAEIATQMQDTPTLCVSCDHVCRVGVLRTEAVR